MRARVILAAQDALPTGEIEFPVEFPGQVFFVAGSIWATEPGTIRIYVEIDGADSAEIIVYANQPNMHIPAISQIFPMALPPGTHRLRLKTAPGTPTASDANDFYHVSMLEFAGPASPSGGSGPAANVAFPVAAPSRRRREP